MTPPSNSLPEPKPLPLPSASVPLMYYLAGLVKAEQFPITIHMLLEQLGGFALHGALTRVGCCASLVRKIQWRARPDYCCSQYGSASEWSAEAATLKYDVGIEFPVNGKPGEEWRMAVTYEPSDAYSVWLWARKSEASGAEALLEHRADVGCEVLAEVVDHVYTVAIAQHNGGFIPLG